MKSFSFSLSSSFESARRIGVFSAAACILLVLLTYLFPVPSFGAVGVAATPPGASSDLSRKDLETLIRRMEDPGQRAALIGQLKLLLKAQAAESPKEPPASPINHMYASLVHRLDKTLAASFRSFQKLPGKIRGLANKWRTSPAKDTLIWDLARLVFAIAAALILLMGFRRAVSRLLPSAPEAAGGVDWPRRVGVALRKWIERALPPGVLLVAGSLFVILFGLGRAEEALLLIFLWSIFLERTITGAVRALLSPEGPSVRLLPVSDEAAGYISLWSRRFVMMGVWGEALARAADVLELGPDAVGALSGLYRLILLLEDQL